MPKIKILSDGTREGTQVIVDGDDLTETRFITHVRFTADSDNYVSFSYGVKEPYTTEKGETQGTAETNYTYTNGGWEQSVAPPAPLGVGQSETKDARVGGRILEDLSGARKASRLILQDRRPK
mgnify:CR=1 FL=1